MSPFAQLLALAGKLPRWKLSPEEQKLQERREIMREYNCRHKRDWRRKNGRH